MWLRSLCVLSSTSICLHSTLYSGKNLPTFRSNVLRQSSGQNNIFCYNNLRQSFKPLSYCVLDIHIFWDKHLSSWAIVSAFRKTTVPSSSRSSSLGEHFSDVSKSVQSFQTSRISLPLHTASDFKRLNSSEKTAERTRKLFTLCCIWLVRLKNFSDL